MFPKSSGGSSNHWNPDREWREWPVDWTSLPDKPKGKSGKDARSFDKLRAGPMREFFLKNIREALDFEFWMCYVTGNETGTFSIRHTSSGDLDSRPRSGRGQAICGNEGMERAFIK